MGQGLVVQGLGPRAPRRRRASASATTGCCAPTRSGTASATSRTGFNILDPIKATVITPGLDVSGKFAKTGIPASIVTRYLAEHGVIVEKTGLYSFFIMFTIGITKGRWNTLVTALQQFKDDYDKNQPLWRILPEFCAKQPKYERVGLRDLCQQIHDMYKANDVARVTTEMYLSDMQPAMKPSDAFACMAHREIDRVEIDNLEGRVTGVLLTPYPPGIPLLIPGERFNRTIVEYLKFARSFNEQFPGFDTDIHGLVEDARGRDDTLLRGFACGGGSVPSPRLRSNRGRHEGRGVKPRYVLESSLGLAVTRAAKNSGFPRARRVLRPLRVQCDQQMHADPLARAADPCRS